MEYTVPVRNTHDRVVQNIAVRDVFRPSEFTVTDPGSGAVRNDTIAWDIDSLEPGENRTFSYRGRLAQSLPAGYEVLNTARAFSSDVSYVPTSNSTVDVGGSSMYGNPYSTSDNSGDYYSYNNETFDYANLPQTGIEDFFSPMENTRQFLTPVSEAAEGNALPLILWVAVIVAGLAGGVMVGKKFVI